MLVARGVRHARVAVAEHLDLVEPDEGGGSGQLERTQLGEEGLLGVRGQAVERATWLAQRRVLEVALLPAGAAHEHRVDAFGVVLGDRRGALGRLVVGVGMDAEQREPVLHAGQASDEPAGRMGDIRPYALAPCDDVELRSRRSPRRSPC